MEENHIKKAIQSLLSAERQTSRVTLQEASEALGYADKTGTIRVLTRNRLHIKDVIIMMVLCKMKTVRVPSDAASHLVINLKCSGLGQIPDLLEAIKNSIRGEPSQRDGFWKIKHGILWKDVADHLGSERQTVYNAWHNRDIEMSLIFAFLHLGFPKIEAKTNSASIEIFFTNAG